MRPASSRENASILLVAEKTPDLQCQHTSCISFCHSGCFSLRMRSLLLRVITDYVKTSPSKAVAVTITAVKKKKQPMSQAHRRERLCRSAYVPTAQSYAPKRLLQNRCQRKHHLQSCNYWTKHRNFGRARPRPTQHRRLRNLLVPSESDAAANVSVSYL